MRTWKWRGVRDEKIEGERKFSQKYKIPIRNDIFDLEFPLAMKKPDKSIQRDIRYIKSGINE